MLQELFLEKEKLSDMNSTLGFPLPPPVAICCPSLFFRDFNASTPPTESLTARYAFDLDKHTSCGGYVEQDKYSQAFMTCLLVAVRGCLTHSQYTAKTCQLGVEVFNPFLEGVENLHKVVGAKCLVSVENCLDPENSVAQVVVNMRNEISVLCEECLARYV